MQNSGEEMSLEEKLEKEKRELEEYTERMLNEVLDKEIPIVSETTENTLALREIIDPEKDIWYSPKSRKPIINEDGFKKIVRATGAEFTSIEIIEKQSDYNNFQTGQVWIEATIKFPNGEENTEAGIANSINCQDNISKSNMPIMATKRAKSRALFRSETINLSVFDESEVRNDIISEFDQKNKEVLASKQKVNEMERQKVSAEKKFGKLFNLVVKSISVKGENVWKVNDINKLNLWLNDKELSDLQRYTIFSRIRFLNKDDQQPTQSQLNVV